MSDAITIKHVRRESVTVVPVPLLTHTGLSSDAKVVWAWMQWAEHSGIAFDEQAIEQALGLTSSQVLSALYELRAERLVSE